MVVFGLASMLVRATPPGEGHDTPVDRLLDVLENPDKPEGSGGRPHWNTLRLPGYWLRGFLLNLINPFTVFFWLGIASADRGKSFGHAVSSSDEEVPTATRGIANLQFEDSLRWLCFLCGLIEYRIQC